MGGAGSSDAAPGLTASAISLDQLQATLDAPKHVDALKDKVILSKREIALVTAYLGHLGAK